MDYDFVKKHINDNSITKIVVTGPQRSGSTFTAKTLGSDLSFLFVDESDLNCVGFDIEKVASLLLNYDKIVVHCPPVSHFIHHLKFISKLAIIFMYRDVNEIISSQNRICWNDTEEINSLKIIMKKELSHINPDYNLPISVLKYWLWENYQIHQLVNYGTPVYNLQYDSLKIHPKYIQKNDRLHFSPKQTTT